MLGLWSNSILLFSLFCHSSCGGCVRVCACVLERQTDTVCLAKPPEIFKTTIHLRWISTRRTTNLGKKKLPSRLKTMAQFASSHLTINCRHDIDRRMYMDATFYTCSFQLYNFFFFFLTKPLTYNLLYKFQCQRDEVESCVAQSHPVTPLRAKGGNRQCLSLALRPLNSDCPCSRCLFISVHLYTM